MTRHFAAIPALLALCALSLPAKASDSEREALMRLAHELDALAPLIDSAEAGASQTDRVRFRYDWLRKDIARIRAGVLEHAEADQIEPRVVAPLRGDYRR